VTRRRVGRDHPLLGGTPFEERVLAYGRRLEGAYVDVLTTRRDTPFAVVRPGVVTDEDLRAAVTALLVAGLTLGSPELEALPGLLDVVARSTVRREREPREPEETPEGWDGEERLLGFLLLLAAALDRHNGPGWSNRLGR